MRIGDIFRYGRPYNPALKELDGIANFFHKTDCEGCSMALLEKGINQIQEIATIEGNRRPAILISSSPHKIGTNTTPWQDFFDVDNGHIRYYGDNKDPENNPDNSVGNKILIKSFISHSSIDYEIRRNATPLLFFKRIRFNGKSKGYIQFEGFGIINNVQLITQFDQKKQRAFSNYVFDFTVFSLKNESEKFNWEWINHRRNKKYKIEDTEELAPNSWKKWVKEGNSSLNNVQRRVSKLLVTSKKDQQPEKDTREEKVLKEIYNYYTSTSTKKHFEGLAAKIAGHILEANGGKYIHGWITPPSSDGGADFIGRLDLGSGFSRVKIIILGQAKCESVNVPTNGKDISRTVARLKRGWIGVYVTTSFFSDAVQREIIEDEYPLLLVHGLRLAKEVLELTQLEGRKNVMDFLINLDLEYEKMIRSRKPEEILFE